MFHNADACHPRTTDQMGEQTCDFSFEGAAHDVLRASVLDGDEIVSRSHGCVGDLVAFGTLPTVHLHLGGPVDVDREGGRACVAGVDHKLRGHAWKKRGEKM